MFLMFLMVELTSSVRLMMEITFLAAAILLAT
jgi:hypothetical protein